MRELKFRQAIQGIDRRFERWHYWGYLTPDAEGIELPLSKVEWDERPSYQYTGLKDKNDREVYESDLVRFKYANMKTLVIAEVKWCLAGWSTLGVGGFMGWYGERYLRDGRCEIIGNIWENPELLKVK